jgi:hypothetical protein
MIVLGRSIRSEWWERVNKCNSEHGKALYCMYQCMYRSIADLARLRPQDEQVSRALGET